MYEIRRTQQGHAFLNVGCGRRYSPEWNNLDLYEDEYVRFYDIRQPLPFGEGAFDGVYASHVLEHLTAEDGDRLAREFSRVLRAGGICRIVVPDMEVISRLYLEALEAALEDPSPERLMRYEWAQLEWLDQSVRQKPGGRMLEFLRRGHYDRRFLQTRFGDELAKYWRDPGTLGEAGRRKRRGWAGFWRRLERKLVTTVLPHRKHPQFSGEAHKWMWDRLSLRLLLERHHFSNVSVTTWDRSRLPDWGRFNLDGSRYDPSRPAKPDSLFVEAVRMGRAD